MKRLCGPLKNDPVEVAHKLAEKEITLYCAGCEPELRPYRDFFAALCLLTGGKYVPLNSSEYLVDMIIGGKREEIVMEKLMAKINDDLVKEAAMKGTKLNEEELTNKIQEIMNSKSNKVLY